VATDAQPLARRGRWPHRLLLTVVVAVAVAAAIAVGLDRAFRSDDSQTASPELQRILDKLVSGPAALAPGATAYVSGPNGTWSGSAGLAATSPAEPMPVDARMRLESVSKIYTAALIELLAQDGTLRVDDTVERWEPGLLPDGDRITIRQLLTMSSGLIDDNDFVNASDAMTRAYLRRVEDAGLRAQLLAAAARVEQNRATVLPETLWIRWAAWQPLLFEPGKGYHYSNIGYDVLGLIAARAGGKPLAVLYRERIFEPLGLDATAYDPQGPIRGPHAHGYGIEPDDSRMNTTSWHWGVGAGGGIVSNAQDTGTFLTALMQGRLLDRQHVDALEGDDLWRGGAFSGCGGHVFGWSGGGNGYKTEVWVDHGGRRVAVLLLNARHFDTAQPAADAAAHDAMAELFCRA
jgi:D-alanyl-D-alanine carboxypeptidase